MQSSALCAGSCWRCCSLRFPHLSFAGVLISVGFAPPVLPVYEQPLCPEPGLMWTPGYWAYGDGWLLLGSRRLGSGPL